MKKYALGILLFLFINVLIDVNLVATAQLVGEGPSLIDESKR